MFSKYACTFVWVCSTCKLIIIMVHRFALTITSKPTITSTSTASGVNLENLSQRGDVQAYCAVCIGKLNAFPPSLLIKPCYILMFICMLIYNGYKKSCVSLHYLLYPYGYQI